MSENAHQIAGTLRRARREAGFSLRELAGRAGTSHATILAYEKGTKVPGAATFLRLLEACGYAVEIRLERRVRERAGLAHAFGGALALAWCTGRARGTIEPAAVAAVLIDMLDADDERVIRLTGLSG